MKKVLMVMGLMAFGVTAALAGPPTFDFTNPDAGAASVPVDGGASLLLAAGAGYGIKRLKAKRAAAKLAKESGRKA